MNGETDIPTCRLCSRPRTNHSSGCPEGEADRQRARVAELERERQAMRAAFKDEMGYLPSGEGAALVRALIGKLHETWRDDDVRADRRLTLWGRAKGAEVQVARVRALHVGHDSPGPTSGYCRACPGKPLPCPTLRALDGEQ